MVARVEPPRGRAPRKEPAADGARYPGLTAEERAVPLEEARLETLDDEPPPPLWIAPVEIPQASRSVGFVGAYPDALPDSLPPDPPRPPPEGLFDVPGLLERLWLARALEAHRERPPTAPAPGASPPTAARYTEGPRGPTTSPAPAVRPSAETAPSAPGSDAPLTGPPPRIPLEEGPVFPPPVAPTLPRSWICPGCYLTNDLAAASCVGCGRAAPRP